MGQRPIDGGSSEGKLDCRRVKSVGNAVKLNRAFKCRFSGSFFFFLFSLFLFFFVNLLVSRISDDIQFLLHSICSVSNAFFFFFFFSFPGSASKFRDQYLAQSDHENGSEISQSHLCHILINSNGQIIARRAELKSPIDRDRVVCMNQAEFNILD